MVDFHNMCFLSLKFCLPTVCLVVLGFTRTSWAACLCSAALIVPTQIIDYTVYGLFICPLLGKRTDVASNNKPLTLLCANNRALSRPVSPKTREKCKKKLPIQNL